MAHSAKSAIKGTEIIIAIKGAVIAFASASPYAIVMENPTSPTSILAIS